MSENTYGKDLVDSLKEPVLEDPGALCAEAAAEIERLRASKAQAVADADALAELAAAERNHRREYNQQAQLDAAALAAADAMFRAAVRRAKKEATT